MNRFGQLPKSPEQISFNTILKDYELIDGYGLHLFVKTNGVKLWMWRYAFEGKKKLMAFGAYPAVTLTAVRKAH